MAVAPSPQELKVRWGSTVPFVLMHLACVPALWLGVSKAALAVCLLSYFVRMFAITAGYHRYFSHRSYRTSRLFQLVLALGGACAAQLGPLWWAAHHRIHHAYADTERDIHPPGLRGFLWAHMGWIFCPLYQVTHYERVRDLAKYPELRWIERNWLLPPAALAASMLVIGPLCGTSSSQMLVWGFFISTVVLYHATFSINSLAHMFGERPFDTRDGSRNSLLLALLTLGEGWHNNHHRFPTSERQGFRWYEVDVTHYILTALSWTGLVWGLREPK